MTFRTIGEAANMPGTWRAPTGQELGEFPADMNTVYVYFIRVEGFIKIGMSRNWRARYAHIKTASPFDIELLHIEAQGPRHESRLHAKFKSFHHRGEWFRSDPQILAYIEERKAIRGVCLLGRV